MEKQNGQTTFSLWNLIEHTPQWASIVLTIWGTAYGCYLMGISNQMFSLSLHAEHLINGIYGMGNLILLAFGAKKKTDNDKPCNEKRF